MALLYPQEYYGDCIDYIGFEIYSSRVYGEKKLEKPKELNGLKALFTAPFNAKCQCQCYILGNDVWIKHRDWFSSSFEPSKGDFGAPLHVVHSKYFGGKKKAKFVYSDGWGDVVLRNEAWIIIRGCMRAVEQDEFILNTLGAVLREKEKALQLAPFELCVGEWERFYEYVLKHAYKSMLKMY